MNDSSTGRDRLGPMLLDVRGLVVTFPGQHGRPAQRVVDDVSFTIATRETVGLVGESGSGKTTIGRAVLGLAPVGDGEITFAGRDITHASYRERRRLSSDLQVVFQDPYSSLNPTRTIGQTLEETLRGRSDYRGEAPRARAIGLLERIGLGGAAANRYPASFSGGQRQRIAIARALMVKPRLVICDEPVSALDLSVQAQILNLLRELQDEFQLSYLFVAHDLAVVRHLSHRIIVLYKGRIMEHGPAAAVYERPGHPYTRSLLEATPVPDPRQQRSRREQRRVQRRASSVSFEGGCPFAPRCPHAVEICGIKRPQLETTPEGVLLACHRWREIRAEASGASSPESVRRRG
jgi:oligopeptide/dipeptide ABC transporter ATP-binding protein